MPSAQFPTKLADLTFTNAESSPSVYASLRSIKKSTLSVHNRLRSILTDAQFIKRISEQYGLPLIANERCGSWYIEPSHKVNSAYFKSTDGHHGIWDFSLRRLNLQLLPVLGKYGGALIVDSTRRGKNLPDAFSKTVPIWAAVINRVLFPESNEFHEFQGPPHPDDLGRSEISQIEARLDGFTQAFSSMGLNMAALREELRCPIRLEWAINQGVDIDESNVVFGDSNVQPGLVPLDSVDSNLLVLCSASRRVRGAEISEGGYIQGAGDDSEGWSHGLTPQVFWRNKDLLLDSPEEELEALIKELLADESPGTQTSTQYTKIQPTTQFYIGVGDSNETGRFDLIINCQGTHPREQASSHILNLECRSGKLGSKDLRDKLPIAINAISQQLKKDSQSQILVTCDSGRDLSAGVIVAVLCLLFVEDGTLHQSQESSQIVDKHLVKKRLVWITSSKPDVNPSRATLQAVNSILMPP